MKYGNSVGRIFIALVIGICLAIFFMQNDQRFKAQCEKKIKDLFQDAFACLVQEGTLESINFFSGTVIAKNIKVAAYDDSWEWTAPLLELKIPFLFSLFNKKIGLEIVLHNVRASSSLINNQPKIVEHIRAMIDGPEGMPVILKSLSLASSAISLTSKETSISSSFNLFLNCREDGFKISCFVLNAHLIGNQFPEIENIKGFCVIEKRKSDSFPLLSSSFHFVLREPLLHGDKEFTLKTQCDGAKLNALATTSSLIECFSANGTIKSLENYTLNVGINFPLNLLMKSMSNLDSALLHGLIKGSILLQANNQTMPSIDYNVHLKDIALGSVTIGSGAVKGQRVLNQWDGTWFINAPKDAQWQGNFNYNEGTEKGALQCLLSETFAIKGTQWEMQKEKTGILLEYDSKNRLNGDYKVAFKNNKNENQHETSGKVTGSFSDIVLRGMFKEANYQIELRNLEVLQINGNYRINDKDRITFSWSDQKNLDMKIDYQIIRSLVKSVFNINAKGEGAINLQAHYKDGAIMGTAFMKDGTIQIAPTYNFIKNFNAEIFLDLNKYKLILTNGRIDLHEGTIKSDRAVIILNNEGDLDFMHIPCVLEKVFINIEKECFVVFSGNSLFAKNNRHTSIYGRLVVDKGQLKKNIFSLITSKQHVAPFKIPFEHTAFDGSLDIGLMTRHPLSIKTSFLDTDAVFDWHVQGTVYDPLVTGKVILSRGQLNFPYKPLYVTHGKIFFVPPHVLDPEVTLVAKGRVRHYDITLRIAGSVLHPHIHFDSTPPLTEEQIITLLLIGSENGSLSLIMPTLIMNNVQHLLFGPEQSSTKLESYFKSLLTPLKNIRIVPSFTDQSARGGLRGALEIDVNDQLHGLIQKNFNQLEDTKFEVEYLFSDDITIRGIKDEHGDLGGELEVKWKF